VFPAKGLCDQAQKVEKETGGAIAGLHEVFPDVHPVFLYLCERENPWL
jgi:hypothetical protein